MPAIADAEALLAVITEMTSRYRYRQTRRASAPLLGAAFRLLARTGAFRWFVNRQHLVATFLSNFHGPDDPLAIAGGRVLTVIPFSLPPGNITVAFTALSYAGELIVTTVADPDCCDDLEVIKASLQSELDHFNPVLRKHAQQRG